MCRVSLQRERGYRGITLGDNPTVHFFELWDLAFSNNW